MTAVRITGTPTAEQDHIINGLVRQHGLMLRANGGSMTLTGSFTVDACMTLLRLTNSGLRVQPAENSGGMMSLLELAGVTIEYGSGRLLATVDPMAQSNPRKDYLQFIEFPTH